MCCFSSPVNDVSETNIFAKMNVTGIETVVQGMTLDESTRLAKSFMDAADNRGIVELENHIYLLHLEGELKNEDTLVALS